MLFCLVPLIISYAQLNVEFGRVSPRHFSLFTMDPCKRMQCHPGKVGGHVVLTPHSVA